MSRRRIAHPALMGPILAWAFLLGLVPQAADGAPLPPAAARQAVEDPAPYEARLIAAHLAALGVSPAEAAARVATLSDAEREAVAARLEEVGAGGSAAGAVAVAIIVVLLAILVLELMGRRVVSRP